MERKHVALIAVGLVAAGILGAALGNDKTRGKIATAVNGYIRKK